jgi:hypothetical protein
MAKSFEKLKKWLGIKDSLKLFERIQRGIYSTEPIQKNKIIIQIKSKYLIEYQKIYNIYKIDEIEEANSLVAFYLTKLLFDKDEFWNNYIKTMPLDLSEFPFFWNDIQLNYLKQTSVYSNDYINFDNHSDTIYQDFEVINQFNKKNTIIQNIDDSEFYNTYIKFRILVGSRIFGYTKYGNQISGMVPYIDLINHSIEPNTTWYFDDNLDSFVLVSIRDINKNEELYDNYGAKNNIELLLYYGFTLDYNPNPILSFNIDDINYIFNLNFDLKEFNFYDLKKKKLLKKKLEKIFLHHSKKIINIKNQNIINIYNDEIKIINFLLINL